MNYQRNGGPPNWRSRIVRVEHRKIRMWKTGIEILYRSIQAGIALLLLAATICPAWFLWLSKCLR